MGTGQAVGVTPVCAAMFCSGLAAWLLTGRGGVVRRARVVFGGGAMKDGGVPRLRESARNLRRKWSDGLGRRLGREWLCLPAGGVVALLGESVLPLLAAVAATPLVRVWLRRRGRTRAGAVRAVGVIDLCGAVAGELRAGRQPDEALRTVLGGGLGGGLGGAEAPVMAAARFGGDVPQALRQAAGRPGAEGLTGVAACWHVAVDRGAGLAAGLDRVAAALRAERDQREEMLAQLAGTRSTSVMLALLPAFGLLMGSALGAKPLWVLLHTPAGLGALVTGGLLEAAGLAWTARIVRAAAGPAAWEAV